MEKGKIEANHFFWHTLPSLSLSISRATETMGRTVGYGRPFRAANIAYKHAGRDLGDVAPPSV